jgi:uncharacterized repeat protein (TIGR03843 family)
MSVEPAGSERDRIEDDSPVAPVLAEQDALDLLCRGSIELEGRLVDASNTTLRGVIELDGVVARCVYKPVRGERPLWDFPEGTLAGREVSAYLVSTATGWGIVPPTVLRAEGPLGQGMCQLWIDEDRQDVDEPLVGFVPNRRLPSGWYRVVSARDEYGRPYVLAHADDPRLARMAVFDAVVNNADRKGGHVIPTVDRHVYGVDHGICFHTEDKLRTVLWGWSGQPLPDDTIEVLEQLVVDLNARLGATLREHLTVREVSTLRSRILDLLDRRCFPEPSEERHVIPWPPM